MGDLINFVGRMHSSWSTYQRTQYEVIYDVSKEHGLHQIGSRTTVYKHQWKPHSCVFFRVFVMPKRIELKSSFSMKAILFTRALPNAEFLLVIFFTYKTLSPRLVIMNAEWMHPHLRSQQCIYLNRSRQVLSMPFSVIFKVGFLKVFRK